MSFAALRNKLLAERDRRQQEIEDAFAAGAPWVATLSLALAGPDKCPPGALDLFHWGRKDLLGQLPGACIERESVDHLGPWLVARGAGDAQRAKLIGIALENLHAAARLLDIDIYLSPGRPLSRRQLELNERPCLLCPRPARECIRLDRHDLRELIGASHALLNLFRHPASG